MNNTDKIGKIYDSCSWGFTAKMYDTGELVEYYRADYDRDWTWICSLFDWPDD